MRSASPGGGVRAGGGSILGVGEEGGEDMRGMSMTIGVIGVIDVIGVIGAIVII